MTEDVPTPSQSSHADLLATLKLVYERRGKSDDFVNEGPIIERILKDLLVDLGPHRLLMRAFALGSTATVWEVYDTSVKQRRALKLARPRFSKLAKIIRVVRAEAGRLAELTHQNIVRVHHSSEIKTTVDGVEYSFPFFLMDYLDGANDFDEFLRGNLDTLSGVQMIEYLRDIALGLSYLHAQGIIHCDVKPRNIIVAKGSPAIVADLGYAKHLDRWPTDEERKLTEVSYTPQYAHPELREEMRRSTDSAAHVAEIRRERLRPAFDLYAFGRTIQEVLRVIRDHERQTGASQSILSPYQWMYLALIGVRLLDGKVENESGDVLLADVLPGLPGAVMEELKYDDMDQALEDLEKLLNFYDLEGAIPELLVNLRSYIQQPDSRIPLTPRVQDVIDHPTFARLAQVTQLGFVSLVYPGACHTRKEHALGTFERCCHLVRALWYDERSCLFRSLMSKADIEAVMLAALLHDLGQYPMAHDLSEVDDVYLHDRFTVGLLTAIAPATGTSLGDVIGREWGLDVGRVTRILTAGRESLVRDRILRSIVSGPLDADKLDYLRRDSIHAGITFGLAIDLDRLYRNVTVCLQGNRKGFVEVAELGVAEKALAVADSVWRARKEMFRQVYWQHTVRALKAMLIYVVRRVLTQQRAKDGGDEEYQRALHSFCVEPMSFFTQAGCRVEVADGAADVNPGGEDPRSDDIGTMDSFSNLSGSDQALVHFLWEHADAGGRRVLRMIERRMLYRRVAVVSYKDEREVFDSVYERFHQARLRGDLDEEEQRRERIEEVVVEACRGSGEHLPQRIDGEPILLVDVPLKALRVSLADEVLWYVPEEDPEARTTAGVSFPRSKKASLEIESVKFDKEVGKIRVFVHPAWDEVVRGCSVLNDIGKLLVQA